MKSKAIIEAMDWEPRPSDIAWAARFVMTVRDGAMWAVPMNGAVYKFDKAAKTLWLVHGEMDDVFLRNQKTFGRIGWKVRRQGEDEMSVTE